MNKKYYDCYSTNQLEYIRKKGIEPIRAKTHHSTKKTVWVFRMSKELDILLTAWTDEKLLRNAKGN